MYFDMNNLFILTLFSKRNESLHLRPFHRLTNSILDSIRKEDMDLIYLPCLIFHHRFIYTNIRNLIPSCGKEQNARTKPNYPCKSQKRTAFRSSPH